jgi:hypothetical protein
MIVYHLPTDGSFSRLKNAAPQDLDFRPSVRFSKIPELIFQWGVTLRKTEHEIGDPKYMPSPGLRTFLICFRYFYNSAALCSHRLFGRVPRTFPEKKFHEKPGPSAKPNGLSSITVTNSSMSVRTFTKGIVRRSLTSLREQTNGSIYPQ